MRPRPIALLAALPPLVLGLAPARAHYPMLECDVAAATVGERTTVEIGYGHPFGNDRYRLDKPVAVFLRHPGGEIDNLMGEVEQVGTPMLPRFRVRFAAEDEGTHLLVVRSHFSEPIDRNLEDHAKLYIHVRGGEHGLQTGWEEPLGTAERPEPIEIVPLTRPYGIPVGGTFRGRVLESGRPAAGASVEAEGYPGPEGAREPFPDLWEYRRWERTGDDGAFSVTFDRPGWWMLSCSTDGAPKASSGTRGHVQRSVVWLFVGPWDPSRRRVFVGANEIPPPPEAPPPPRDDDRKDALPPPAPPAAAPEPPEPGPAPAPPANPPSLGPGLLVWAVLLGLGIALIRAMRPAPSVPAREVEGSLRA